MGNVKKDGIKILFSQSHNEQLNISEGTEGENQFSLLRQELVSLGYVIDYTTKALTSNQLVDTQVLIIGAPKYDGNDSKLMEINQEEIETIKQFVAQGGGLLLAANAETMLNPPMGLNKLAAMVGLQFKEFLNYPPTYLQVFWPDYITANVKRVKLGKVAFLSVGNRAARPLAFTKATQQTILASNKVERGRVLAIGDIGLFSDGLFNNESNKKFTINMFEWLAARNVIDIQEIVIPETVKLGQTATVVLQLYNNDAEARPQVECLLESDSDALISESARKSRSIPPGKDTRMQWTVRPQILGEQKLRIAVHCNGYEPLFFDQLPQMLCLAPGYFTLEIKDETGNPKTTFQTGESFAVDGTFHCPVELDQFQFKLDLQHDDGLVKRGHEHGIGVDRWCIQATAPGTHKLTLSLVETGQLLPALVRVNSSTQDRLNEIQAAYVNPLDAEIAERLRQLDESLSHIQIQQQPFRILSPKEFIETVYKNKDASWLQGVLTAASRENWYNLELLDMFLTYIAPTYLPNYGSFIPYDPNLASHLTRLHPKDRRYLEYNLLCSEESKDINIKQNIAAYLLHEKYGHGFFYIQTRLGQQLAILHRHGFPEEPDEKHLEIYKEAAKLINESATIVNEGFATWLELTFLGKLDHEVRQAVYPRQILLIQEATGLYDRELDDGFFQAFPPKFDSRYREGFEYLDFISQKFNLRCAIRMFLIATNIEFGIAENFQSGLQIRLQPEEIKRLLLKEEKDDWRSHLRLRKIAELLYEQDEEANALVRNQYCPTECRQSGCPLEAFISERLQWRIL